MKWFNRSILIFCLSIFCDTYMHAQIGLSVQKEVVLPIPDLFLKTQNLKLEQFSPVLYPKGENSEDSVLKPPKVYAFEHLAFFCKIEVQLEQAVRFPVKFRLGDVQYVDKLEGKTEDW